MLRRCPGFSVVALLLLLWPSTAPGQSPPVHDGGCSGDPGPDVDSVVAVVNACYYAGRVDRGLALADSVLERLQVGETPDDSLALSRVLVAKGRLAATRSFLLNVPVTPAVQSLERALELASEARGASQRAEALVELGFAEYVGVFLGQGEFAPIRSRFEEALRIHREAGDLRGRARAVFHLGLIDEREGLEGQAVARYREALELSRECGCELEESYALRHLAFIHAGRREHERALDLFRESLALRQEVGFRVYLPFSFMTVADELVALDRADAAEPYATRALELAGEMGFRRVRVLALLTLGQVHLAGDADDLGAEAFHEALELAREIGYETGVRAAREGLARVQGGAESGS